MATRDWVTICPVPRVYVASVTLDGGDTSGDLELSNYPDKTVHIFPGFFGTSSVSVKGLNSHVGGTTQNLHRTDDPTQTYTGLVAEAMGHIIENPRYIRASASAGTGTALIVTIVAVTSS